MKKIIALLGSKRKGNTYRALTQIEETMKKELGSQLQFEILPLFDFKIDDCIGCQNCIHKGSCVFNDDSSKLMAKLIEADGIILASPVYMKQVSGKIKTFFDRTCSWYHRPTLAAKPILSVVTTQGSGLSDTLKYLQSVSIQWGGLNAGKIGRNARSMNKPVEEKEVKKFIRLLNSPESYSPTLNELINFETQKELGKFLGELDVQYWSEKQWIDAPYYFSCKVNFFKKQLSKAFGKFLNYVMTKNKK